MSAIKTVAVCKLLTVRTHLLRPVDDSYCAATANHAVDSDQRSLADCVAKCYDIGHLRHTCLCCYDHFMKQVE